jgi:hypothetical protein
VSAVSAWAPPRGAIGTSTTRAAASLAPGLTTLSCQAAQPSALARGARPSSTRRPARPPPSRDPGSTRTRRGGTTWAA